MSSSLLIILLVAVWLLVLLPMLVNTKEPIRRTSKAFSETRVLHRGDEKRLTPRRVITPHPVDNEADNEPEKAPRRSARKDRLEDNAKERRRRSVRRRAKRLTVDPATLAQTTDTTDSTADDVQAASERTTSMAAKTSSEVIQATLPFDEDVFGAEAAAVVSDAPTEEIVLTPELMQESLDSYHDENPLPIEESEEAILVEEMVEEIVACDDPAAGEAADETADEAVDEAVDEELVEDTDGDVLCSEESDVDADDIDVLADELVEEYEAAAVETQAAKPSISSLGGALAAKIANFSKSDRNIPEPAPQYTLSAEDIAEAERRRGRGGFDPVAAEAAAQKRYKRRTTIFLILLALLIPMIVVGALLGGLVWIAPVAWVGVIAMYLAALRSQVRLEKQLRERRLERMRRARAQRAQYGYQQEEAAPALHFHGQYSLVDVDDGDPLFDHLDTRPFMEEYMATHAEEFTYDDGGYLRDRFGRVRINASRYPDERGVGGEPDHRYDTAGYTDNYTDGYTTDTYVYDDPYSVGDYTGGRSVDYWAEAEAADNVVRFELPRRDNYRDVG